ncbi:hypothetical protein [Methanosarcina lacustris]|uniref:hypothetical protein n=1 Tax=Methanosarcina lacustris TaxID=170861 RepID=UPI000B2277E1|nr:hypothetical protein [Methanosarcina lacustris]
MENPFYFCDYNTYILIFGQTPQPLKSCIEYGSDAPVDPDRENQSDVAENNYLQGPHFNQSSFEKISPHKYIYD